MAEAAAKPCVAKIRREGPWALLCLVAVLPVVRAVLRSIRVGWVPIADEGVIAIRAHDVLTTRTPALGQMSLASATSGAPTRSPGPMGYWVLAPAAQAGPLWLIPVAAGVVAVVALIASVHLARRRGGVGLAVAVTAGIVLSARAVDPINHAVGWNPSIGLAPLILLVLLAWSVGVGERRWFPATVLVASFVAQVHVAYLLPAVAAVGVALVGGWGAEVLAWRRTRTAPGGLRPLAWGTGIGLVLWAAPLLQQVLRRPGNLTLISRSSGGDSQGTAFAGQVLGWSVGAPPAATQGQARGFDALVRLTPPWPSAPTVVGAAVLVALAVLAVVGVRRRDREIAVPPLLVLALLAAAAVAVRATPTDARGVSVIYTTWWLVPIGMMAWVVLAATALRLLPLPDLGARRSPALAVGVVAITALVALAMPIRDPEDHMYPVARAAGDAVAAAVEPGETYEVMGNGSLGLQLGSGLAYRVRRAGADPVMRTGDGISAGPEYVPTGRRCAGIVAIDALGEGEEPPVPRPDREVLAVIAIPPGPAVDVPRAVVTMTRDDGPPSC